jgi:hypothetical protein
MRALLAILVTSLLLGPGAWAKQKDRPALKLVVSVDTAAPEQQPILVVNILNQSGHALRIPDPPLLCKPAPGALSLQVKFTAENSHQAEPPADCDLEVDPSGLPDIRERSKDWLVLKQGQAYEARRPLAMGIDTNAHGTYEIWVIYDGPCANDAELEEMHQAGIAVPAGRFQSDKVTYKVSMPK